MKKILYALLAVAATLSFASCDNGFNEEAPEIGANTIAFKLERSDVQTRSASGSPVISRQMIPMGDPVDGMNFYLEETVTDLNASYGPETKGTPVYTENFADMFDSFYGVARNASGTLVVSDGAFVGGGDGVWKREMSSDIYGDGIDELYFYLRAPQTVEGLTGLTYSTWGTGRTQIEFDYTPPTLATDQQDIVFAARSVTRDEAKDCVPILFNHMLTGIKFAIANENDDDVQTYISQVELKGKIRKSAHFRYRSGWEGNDWVDDPDNHSSAGFVTTSNEQNLNGTTDSYKLVANPADITPVNYDSGSFGNKGAYPTSFGKAGNKKNLNDSDASMTFWLVPQTNANVIGSAEFVVTFHVVSAGQDSGPITRTIKIGEILKQNNVFWKAGELRTYTLKPELIDVDITDKVNGFTKTDVVITNTGNIDTFIRAGISANWFGYAGTEYGVAAGFTSASTDDNTFLPAWKILYSGGTFTDNFGGSFTGLPGSDWHYNANDGFFYYENKVPAGQAIPSPLFTKYSISGTNIPPAVWYVDNKNTRQPFTNIKLVMEIPVQAIDAADSNGNEYSSYQAAWQAVGVSF